MEDQTMQRTTLFPFLRRVRLPIGFTFLFVWLFCTLLYAAVGRSPTPIASGVMTEETSTPTSPLAATPQILLAKENVTITTLAWGDVNDDHRLDLAVGYADGLVQLWQNNRNDQRLVGLPPAMVSTKVWSLAWGDMDGDYDLDLVVGGNGGFVVYENVQGGLNFNSQKPGWAWQEGSPEIRSVAWADMDFDNDLDLAVGGFDIGPLVFRNDEGKGFAAPLRLAPAGSQTTAVAWGDFNNDYLLDLAVANSGQPSIVYENIEGKGFENSESSSPALDTRSIAWGNFNGDAWLDLAVGNYDAASQIFANTNGVLATTGTPVPTPAASMNPSQTTSIAWGDYNNDGTIELAVANDGQPSRVYEYVIRNNTGAFEEKWSSDAIPNANAIAWGDWNSDSDLDLAVAGHGNPTLGIFINVGGSVGSPLVFADRPGRTSDAYFLSAAEIITGPPLPTIEFTYALLGSDEKQELCYHYIDQDRGIEQPIIPTPVASTPWGGYTWYTATWQLPPGTIPNPPREESNGHNYYISDNARIRIDRQCSGTDIPSAFTAISPPFRVRITACIWPKAPRIRVVPQSGNQALYQFIGQITAGSGEITYTWEFGDGFTKEGQRVTHRYHTGGLYTVNLKVEGEPCPINRPSFASTPLYVAPEHTFFLPLVARHSAVKLAKTHPAAAEQPVVFSYTLPQVTGLTGRSEGVTALAWQRPQDQTSFAGYRVYRYALDEVDNLELLAELPPSVTEFSDPTSDCGHAYFVTTFAGDQESDASTTTYYGLPCPSE